MRKLISIAAFSLLSLPGLGQAPSLQDKLYYTCKVWGFVRYYHSEVSTCNVNWDSVLLSTLPAVRAAATVNAFNDVLDTILAAAGPMALSTTYFPDTLPPELKRNRDFSWISAPLLRADVQVQLDTVRNNFRPHAECWVSNNTFTTSYYSWLVFSGDDPELNINTVTAYPDANNRLLMFFKYWNSVCYFNPYNYVLDAPWDTTLSRYVLQIDAAATANALYTLYLKINTTLDDAHVYAYTYSTYYDRLPGYKQPSVRLKYTGGRYVVTQSAVAGIYPGDAIVSKDGLTTMQWEDSLRPYYSSGNPAVFRRLVCENILGKPAGNVTLVVEDSTGTNHTFTVPCTNNGYYNEASYYYPNDSLNTIKWTTMSCDAGYVNMGNMQAADVNTMYDDLRNKPAIIFDLRNYPSGTEVAIANLMLANKTEYLKLIVPDVTYPGTFSWKHDSTGTDGNPAPYSGKVILLMDEQTQSQAEFSCMILETMPDVVKIGSQTAGTDGSTTYWRLSQDLYTGFTSQGMFYPNGDSTQRIGIVPDIVTYPTRAGIRNHDDELLDQALQVACAASGVKSTLSENGKIRVYPNPADNTINVELVNIKGDNIVIRVTDMNGRKLMTRETRSSNGNIYTTFDMQRLSPGMYLVEMVDEDGQTVVRKVVKE